MLFVQFRFLLGLRIFHRLQEEQYQTSQRMASSQRMVSWYYNIMLDL